MANNEFYSRIIHKHDIEANWNKAVNFIPKQGEIIVYDIDNNHDYERIKIGNGTNKVNNLPFIEELKFDYFHQDSNTLIGKGTRGKFRATDNNTYSNFFISPSYSLTSKILTWDGDTTDKEVLTLGPLNAYRITDEVPKLEELNHQYFYTFSTGEEYVAKPQEPEYGEGLYLLANYHIFVLEEENLYNMPQGIYFGDRRRPNNQGYYVSSFTYPLNYAVNFNDKNNISFIEGNWYNFHIEDSTIIFEENEIDIELNSTSTNAVQNKAVTTAINNLSGLVGDTAVLTQINNAITETMAGCWISFTDENGNPTSEPYIHWNEEV